MYDGTMKNVRQQDTATEIQIIRAQSEDILSARINQKTDFVYNAKTGELKIGEETFVTDAVILDFSLLFDDVILEMTADCGTITDIFELPEIAEKFCNEKEWEYMEMCMSNRMAGVILCSGTVGGGTARPFRQWGTCAESHYSAGITCSKGDDLIQYVYEPGI